MTSLPNYFSIVADAIRWALEDPIIAGLVDAKGGYTAEEIQSSQVLLDTAQTSALNTQDLAGQQKEATQALLIEFKIVKDDLSSLRRVMKNNLPAGDPLFTRLGLNEPQPRGQDALLQYSVRAFSNGRDLSPEESAVLTKRRWDQARFEAALTQAQTVMETNDAQENAKAQTIAATDELYQRVAELDAWFRPFAKDARVILADTAGALEKMGLARRVPAKPRR